MKKMAALFMLVLLIFAVGPSIKAADSNSGQLAITKANIPDGSIRSAIKKAADANKDGVLSLEERQHLTEIDLGSSNKMIKNLKGIDYFPNLQLVKIDYIGNVDWNPLISLKKLNKLFIYDYSDKKLDLSMLTQLKELEVREYESEVRSAKFPKNLQKLVFCIGVEKVNLSNLSQLKYLEIYGVCALQSLNLDQCKKLKFLKIDDGQNLKLKVSKNTALETLFVSNLINETFDLSHNKNLKDIYIDAMSSLEKLKLPSNSSRKPPLKIDITWCISLTKCNFNDAKNIEEISMYNVAFKKFSTSLHNLVSLSFERCEELKKIDVTKNRDLWKFEVINCPVTSLDVSKNKYITSFFTKDCKYLKHTKLPKGKKILTNR